MKVVAHPLMVAVALGLLGPSALEAPDTLREEPTEVSMSTPNRHEIERAERMWIEARESFDAEQAKRKKKR